jgi:hypothetical protein
MGVGDAVRLLQTAETVEAAPDTREALRAGVVSVRQAKAIGAAEAVDPGAGRRLLADAPNRSTRETEDAAARIVAAGSSETDAEKAERLRKKRSLRTGTDADGMGYGHWLLEPVSHARLMALIDANKDTVFHDARAAGLRENSEAYAADALAALADRPARSNAKAKRTATVPGGSGDAARADEANGVGDLEDWSFTKMVVRVDLAALDRGELAPGEVCEVAGRGPIPVADAWRMIDGDAFVAAVATKGSEIEKVVHLGRKPTVLQRTALEWFSAGECSIEGCTSPGRLGRHRDHHPVGAGLTVRLSPRSQDSRRLPLRSPAPLGQAPAHPTRWRRPTRCRPARREPARAHPPPRHRPPRTARRRPCSGRPHPGRPLRHRLRPEALQGVAVSALGNLGQFGVGAGGRRDHAT